MDNLALLSEIEIAVDKTISRLKYFQASNFDMYERARRDVRDNNKTQKQLKDKEAKA